MCPRYGMANSSAEIIVLRLASQGHAVVEAAIRRVLTLLPQEALVGMLWIVEEHRIRIHEYFLLVEEIPCRRAVSEKPYTMFLQCL